MDLSQTIETLKRENDHFFEACNKESDRGLALVAAEFMDATLERLLLARFASGIKQRPKLIKPLFEGFGPLSTFSARINVSYAIDLLEDWMASDLDLIRRIRNELAHSLQSKTFRDPEITKMVNQFACITKLTKNIENLKCGFRRMVINDSERS
jgi:DNA-binding MltR family transcriptional regulator